MDLRDAEVFYRVVEEGSLTSAAARLGRPKSSVSRSLARLEEDLGVRLLMRTTRRIHLSDAGKSLHVHLHSIFSELVEAEAEVRERQESPQGHLRVTMPVELGLWFMGPLIAEFMLLHPKVAMDVDLSARVVNLVEEGFDLGLRIGEFSDSSLVGRKLGMMSRIWVASPEYLVRCGRPESLDDLLQHEVVLFRHTHENHVRMVDRRNGRASPATVRGRLSVSILSMSVHAALAGLGLALSPPFLCERELLNGSLVHVLEDYYCCDGGLYAMFPSRQHMPSVTRAFLEFIAEIIQGQSRFQINQLVNRDPIET